MNESFFTTYEMTEPPPIQRQTNIPKFENLYSTKQNDRYMISADIPYETPFEIDSENPFIFQTEQFSPDNTKISSQPKKITGTKAFEEAFNKAVKINPEVANYRNFLVKTAKRESNFNSYIQNTTGAPYYGYFQMGKEEIKKTTGLSVEQFRNNPVQQILGAVELYKLNLKTLKAIKVYDIGKQKGYSDDALVSGAWAGGPGGVKKYLSGKGDPSDAHWYGGQGGTSVGKIMNEWKKEESL